MVFGRLRDAMADAAETLRRVFVDPTCHHLDPGAFVVPARGLDAPVARVLEGSLVTAPRVVSLPLVQVPPGGLMPLLDRARLVAEEGWSRWQAGAEVVAVPPLAADGCRRTAIPALPRTLASRTMLVELPRPRVRSQEVRLAAPSTRKAAPALPRPVVREDLKGMWARPVALRGEVPEAMGAAWTMRQVLHVVRQSGENARNLELLGCFQVPREGVLGLAHDARIGCLWVQLGPQASRSPRQRLILARRKDDRTLVTCFMEES